MREELIRVENGCFRREDEFYRFEISISRGECIGVYVDDHFTSGTAYLDLFVTSVLSLLCIFLASPQRMRYCRPCPGAISLRAPPVV